MAVPVIVQEAAVIVAEQPERKVHGAGWHRLRRAIWLAGDAAGR
jgi:hypothetical protein